MKDIVLLRENKYWVSGHVIDWISTDLQKRTNQFKVMFHNLISITNTNCNVQNSRNFLYTDENENYLGIFLLVRDNEPEDM